jgi:hypothetical protein
MSGYILMRGTACHNDVRAHMRLEAIAFTDGTVIKDAVLGTPTAERKAALVQERDDASSKMLALSQQLQDALKSIKSSNDAQIAVPKALDLLDQEIAITAKYGWQNELVTLQALRAQLVANAAKYGIVIASK